MLVYAFKVLQQKNYKDMETVRFDNAQNLFAAILAQGIGQQLKQGLYKEYIDQKETSPCYTVKFPFRAQFETR